MMEHGRKIEPLRIVGVSSHKNRGAILVRGAISLCFPPQCYEMSPPKLYK